MIFKSNPGQKPFSQVAVSTCLIAGLSLMILFHVSNIAYGQVTSQLKQPELTRYNIECGLQAGMPPELAMQVLVQQYGVIDGSRDHWPDNARELFDCMTVIQLQEKAGTGPESSVFD